MIVEIFHNIILGFQVASSWENLLFCFVGVLIGTLIGVLPGIGPTTGVAILIPITFGMNATTAIITMCGVYYGAMYGGSTTSILLNVPGESSSVVTTLDGYQMARNGRPGPALGMAALSSFIAGTFAVLMLTFLAPPLADYAVSFGPPEYFALTFMGLTLVTSLGGDSPLKGLISGALGLLVACVGIDAQSGVARFTFDNMYLLDGVGFIGMAVGLFAASEVLVNIEEPMQQVFTEAKLNFLSLFPNLQDWKDSFGALWRGSILGFVIGVLPGAGATIASFMAYGLEKKLSKHPEKFGTGVIEGVAADTGHPRIGNDGGYAGGADDPWAAAGSVALLDASRFRLGAHCQHVHRERDACHPEHADDRHLGPPAEGSLLGVDADDHHDLGRRRICDGQQHLRYVDHVLLRRARLCDAEAGLPSGADGSGAGIGTDGGDVPPPVADDLPREHGDLLHPSHLRRVDDHRSLVPLRPPLPHPVE
jgi:TctA family transporter